MATETDAPAVATEMDADPWDEPAPTGSVASRGEASAPTTGADPWDEPAAVGEAVTEQSVAEQSVTEPSGEIEASSAASTDDVDPGDEPSPSSAGGANAAPESTADPEPLVEEKAPGGGTSGGDPALLDEPDPWD